MQQVSLFLGGGGFVNSSVIVGLVDVEKYCESLFKHLIWLFESAINCYKSLGVSLIDFRAYNI